MKRNRFIIFGAFLIGGGVLLLLTFLFKYDFYLVSFMLFILFAISIIGALFDQHINPYLRVAFLVVGLLFLIASMVGLLIKEDNLELPIYCLILAILEIINGCAESVETYHLFKEKNKMWILLAIDSLFEIVLGVLMVFEKHETLRLHSTLIAADLFFEGTIKFINEYVEDKRGIHA